MFFDLGLTEGDCETVMKLPNPILLKHCTQQPDSSQARLCGMVCYLAGLNKAGRIDKHGEQGMEE